MYKLFYKKNQAGMSMVEVIIVIFIISILFTLVFLEVSALLQSHKQRYEDIAYHVANKQMEVLRATAFSSLPSSGTISDSQLSLIPSGAGTFTVANYSSYSGVKQITVTVTWNDGASKSTTINTLAANGGFNP